MALAKDTVRDYAAGAETIFNSHPAASATTWYEGGAIGLTAAGGLARPLLDTDTFAGFADRGGVNPSGGSEQIRVRAKGIVRLLVTGVVITSVGAKVYATADDTFTLTSTTAVAIGRVYRYLANGEAEVYFEAHALRGLVDGDL